MFASGGLACLPTLAPLITSCSKQSVRYLSCWLDQGIILECLCPIAHCCSQYFTTAMALNLFSPARRTGLALVAGLLLFAVLAAATVGSGDKITVGDLSVAEIEDKLQVIASQACSLL